LASRDPLEDRTHSSIVAEFNALRAPAVDVTVGDEVSSKKEDFQTWR